MTTLIFGDFETYYSKDYTLRKMTAIEYVLDPRFECLGIAIQEGRAGKPYWVTTPEIPALIGRLRQLPDVAFVSHNALFDMLVLGWRYNYVPPLMLDTLGMSRALLSHLLKSCSLDSVSKYFGFGAKGTTVARMMGVNYQRLVADQPLHNELALYARDDVSKCARIFYHLIEEFPASEVPVMDMVLRACVAPQFKLDVPVLEQHLADVLQQKQQALQLASVIDAGDLRSNEKFAQLLKALGIDPPMKLSPTTGKITYAFAKTDSDFIDLAENEDPRVQALVAARLGHKTSLEETRTRRLMAIGNLQWPVGEHWMPVPLGYGRAHTHRFGGDMKLNMQNLPRRSALRTSLIAPKGRTVLSIDLSQIEARIVAWLCEQLDLLEAFALGEDIYSEFASEVFGVEVSKKINPDYRFIGKTAILGLGYGMSWMKFILSVKSGSKNQLGRVIELTPEVGQKVVDTYRRKYRRIQDGWNKLQSTGITALSSGGLFVFGPCEFTQQQILLPNGLKLHYHDLAFSQGQIHSEWTFTYAGVTKRLYGAKVLENLSQSLARIIITDIAMRVKKVMGLRFAHQVHDELIYVIREREVEQVGRALLEQAAIRPIWAPELPIASELKAGPNYGELAPLTFES